jgi:transposase InsO family protein
MSDVFTKPEVLVSHANARLNFHGRCLLVSRVIDDGRPVAHVAKELGISRQCAHRWVNRFRAEGPSGLIDRSSRPHHCPRRTSNELQEAVLVARAELRAGPARISQATGVPARTVSRILTRHAVPLLAVCDPLTGEVIRATKHTAIRYERDKAGDLIHIDVKKIGKIPPGGGWRAHGRGERPGHKRGLGYDYVHAAVDDHSRLAYAEILADEKGTTCAAFLTRAAEFFNAHGIQLRQVMSDNAKNYTISGDFQDAIVALGAQHITIRPHCPWQNGKVERFNRTMAIEWAYRQIFDTNHDRTAALAPWIEHYNTGRNHSAIGGRPPISRLSPT